MFSTNDASLALPQLIALDRNSAKWILHLASRHRKPIFAFSEKFVAADAVASNNNISSDAEEIILSWISNGIPNSTMGWYGQKFTVKINPQVAKFLDLHLPENLNAKAQQTINDGQCSKEGGHP